MTHLRPDLQAFDVSTAPEHVTGHEELAEGLKAHLADDGLNSDRREKLAVLERRAAHLERVIASYNPNGNPSYAIAEAGALKWAIRCLRAAGHVALLRRIEHVATAMEMPSQQEPPPTTDH